MDKFVVISYPGMVKNAEKALQTLGGISKVSTDYYHNRNFELSHLPENPYVRPTYSQKKEDSCFTLVVRARRRKVKRETKQNKKRQTEISEVGSGAAVESEFRDNGATEIQSEVLGVLSVAYEFRGMCDFQYLPIRLREDGSFEDLLPKLIPADIPSVLSWFDSKPGQNFEDEGPLILPPFAFSRFLFSSPYIMCRETEHREQNIKHKKSRKDVIGLSVRAERKALSLTVGGQDEFPLAPTEEVVREVDAKIKKRIPHEAVERIFNERPMWTRNAILQQCGIEESMSKILLPKYAFYITCGPWGRLWCKFGFDPRKDPKAAKYQTIMCQFKHHEKIAERNRLRLGSMGTFLTGRDTPKKVENPESTWQYKSGQLPGFRQMWYSVCDIHLPMVEGLLNAQENNIFARLEPKDDSLGGIVKKEPGEKVVMDSIREGRVADPDAGWLTRKILDSIRDAIREDVGRIVHEMKRKEEEASLEKFKVDEWSHVESNEVKDKPQDNKA